MKTETTRNDLIKIRGQIGEEILTKLASDKEINIKELITAGFRVMYAILNFLIRKTWGE